MDMQTAAPSSNGELAQLDNAANPHLVHPADHGGFGNQRGVDYVPGVRAEAEALVASPPPPLPPAAKSASVMLNHWRAIRDWLNTQVSGEDEEAVEAGVDLLNQAFDDAVEAPCASAEDALAMLTICQEDQDQDATREFDGRRAADAIAKWLAGQICTAPTGPLADLVAAYFDQRQEVFRLEDARPAAGSVDAISPELSAAYTAWHAIGNDILRSQPRDVHELGLVLDFLAEDAAGEGPLAEAVSSLQRMIHGLAAQSASDAELIALGDRFEPLGLQIDAGEFDDPADVEAVVEAMDPLVQRAKELQARSMAGLRAKAVMAEHFLPTRDTDESEELQYQLARGVVEDILAMTLPDTWASVTSPRPHDYKLTEVIRRAISQGHKPEEIAQIVYTAPALPNFAPAIYFEKPDGDLVIVSQHGTQTSFGQHRDGYEPARDLWVSLSERLAQSSEAGRALDVRSGSVSDDEIKAWDDADNALVDEILETPALSLCGLRVKAQAVVRCGGTSATPEDVDLGDCTNQQLATDIVRTLARL